MWHYVSKIFGVRYTTNNAGQYTDQANSPASKKIIVDFKSPTSYQEHTFEFTGTEN